MKKLLPLLMLLSAPLVQADVRADNYSNYVTLYEHMSFNEVDTHGRRLSTSDDISNLKTFYFNNLLSSIEIPQDWTVTLYSEENYRGEAVTLNKESKSLDYLDKNDTASSIRVTKYTHTPDAHIAGYNNEHLTNVSREQCQVACSEQSWCQSFDYFNNKNACDLSDANAAEVGGLKVGKYGYDHYSIK
jgi:hypothetical protein